MYKRYFPDYRDHVYLDNAATTMTPAKVIMEYNYYWYFNANIHRSPHKLGQEATEKYENNERTLKPEYGLLELRKKLKFFANLRPIFLFDSLINASTLKPDVIKNL